MIMGSPKPLFSSLVFRLLIILAQSSSIQLIFCSENQTKRILCPEIEKKSLLSFKNSVQDPDNALSSWNSQVDCCQWERVVCDNVSGHVLELHLQSETSDIGMGGELNPSLLNLKNLRYLDLSWNSFEGTIPSFMGSFASLEYLDLSTSEFQGTIPISIGNLSSLRYLDLQENYGLVVDNLEWLRGLSRMERLNMNYLDLSRATDWAQVIQTLPSLVQLNLSWCSLSSISIHDHVVDNISTSLSVLDLSQNDLHVSVVPTWLSQLSKLVHLDLSYNSFIGPIPTIANSTTCSLQHLDLSDNKFDSDLPDWVYTCNHLEFMALKNNSIKGMISEAIGNLSSLQTINLSFNELSGEIPREIEALCGLKSLDLSVNTLRGDISRMLGSTSGCFGRDLESLHLAYNQLSGYLPARIGELTNLQSIHLRTNSLSGPIPNSLGRLGSLSDLRLENNKFSGNLPESLGQLSGLMFVTLQNNLLEGVVTETHFANLTNLRVFIASGNRLVLKMNQDWFPSFNLTDLGMGSWDLGRGTAVPEWLKTQKASIQNLDLSNTGISSVPDWIWEIPRLNLSHNKLHGRIPDIKDSKNGVPRVIYLSSNQFNSSLPRVIGNVVALDLSNNSFSGGLSQFICNTTVKAVQFLHLGRNLISGELPDCWMNWPSLTVLNIQDNNLSGHIPNSIAVLSHLLSLNLHNNNLSGTIPSSIQSCTIIQKIDLSNNSFTGNVPDWMSITLANLRFLILSSNKLSGIIHPSICYLNYLQILDLSDNKISGTVPSCVNNFTAMATKTSGGLVGYQFDYAIYSEGIFSESASVTTKGRELQYDVTLGLVTNIDLSRNNFSGEIPQQLTRLAELQSLNLSGNHFTGMIPNSIGDMNKLESLDLSRNYLSGEIPKSLSELSFLSSLDLSYNNLTGLIPQSAQIQSLPASGFLGNKLCGPPLAVRCDTDGEYPASDPGNDKGSESMIDHWFFIFLSVGYGAGLGAVITTLSFKKTWRDSYYGFFEDLWYKFYSGAMWHRNNQESGIFVRSEFYV